MLTCIKLKGFQAHENLVVPLEPGVNVIVGQTNVGKSSVFRAVRWLLEHKPITGYEKHDTKETSVRISTEDSVVVRFKEPGKYGYAVNDQPWVACGNIQPLSVRSALKLDEINLQGQHDPPFLLTLSPGAMARELNNIVDLSVIDKYGAAIKQSISKTKSHLEATKGILETKEAEYAKTAWVDQAVIQWEAIQARQKELTDKIERQYKVVSWQALWNYSEAQIEKFDQFLGKLELVTTAVAEFLAKVNRKNDLAVAILRLEDVTDMAQKLDVFLESADFLAAKTVEFEKKKEKLATLLRLQGELSGVEQRGKGLKGLITAAERLLELDLTPHRELLNLLKSIKILDLSIQSLGIEIHDTETKLKDFICPVCGKIK